MSERPSDTEQDDLNTLSRERPPTPPSAGSPDSWPGRPGIDGFEKWLQKHLIFKLGGVIVIAFLFKSFVPIELGFTLGLIVGAALLAIIYAIGLYRKRQS